jgi:DNA mismatch endonuclease, patch repair protein
MEAADRVVSLGGGVVVPYPESGNLAATRVARGNQRRDTAPELALRSALYRRGLRYRKDHLVRCSGGLKVRPDVVFTRVRVAIFVDGCFWHSCPEHGRSPGRNTDYWGPKLRGNVARDRRVNEVLEADGWRVVRVWEHEDVVEAGERIASIVSARRAERRQAKLSWSSGSRSGGRPAAARTTDSASNGGTALPS